jgi:hypothetical protein
METRRLKMPPAARVTRFPEPPPSAMYCPACDELVTFIEAVVSGVNPVERWDVFACRRCGGAYEYRHRTRVLKRTN